MARNGGFKKGDHVVVNIHDYDTTPDGKINDCYGFGTTGIIDGFRNNPWHGRQAVVLLDSSTAEDPRYVDWSLDMIEQIY